MLSIHLVLLTLCSINVYLQSSDPDLWTLELPPSQDTSVGCMAGVHIFADGMTEEGRENEDR